MKCNKWHLPLQRESLEFPTSRQIIATSVEVTPNGGLFMEPTQNALSQA